MKNSAKISIFLVAMILLSSMLLIGVAFAQQGQGQQSVMITVTDEVTGKAALGVTTLIRSESSGAIIQNLGTVPQGGTTVSLPSGQYSIYVQIAIFGFPVTLTSVSFDASKPTTVELTVSAIFIPIQYVPLLIYIIVFIIILAIIISVILSVIRRLRKPKKPNTTAATAGPTSAK